MAVKETNAGGETEVIMAHPDFPYLHVITRRNKKSPDKKYFQIRHPMVPVINGTSQTSAPKNGWAMPIGLTPDDKRFKVTYDKRINELEQLRQTEGGDELVHGTVAHLVHLYKAHEIWLTLKDKTRSDYTPHLDEINQRWGSFQVQLLDEELTATLRDTVRDRSGAIVANTMMAVLANLQKVALEKKTTFNLPQGFNFAKGVRRFGVKSGVISREVLWSDDDESAFIDVCKNGHGLKGEPGYLPPNRKVLRTYLLFVMTGQRLGDVLNMKISHLSQRELKVFDADGNPSIVNDWGIEVTQSKRAAKVWIRCHRDLLPELELYIEMNKRSSTPSLYFVSRNDGQPYAENSGGFPKLWRKYQLAAGVGDLQRRDLRRTICIRMLDVGCSVEQIRDITGHSLQTINEMIEIYGLRTGIAGAAGIVKLETRNESK